MIGFYGTLGDQERTVISGDPRCLDRSLQLGHLPLRLPLPRHTTSGSVYRPENIPFALLSGSFPISSLIKELFHYCNVPLFNFWQVTARSPVTDDQCQGAIEVCHQARAHPLSCSSMVHSRTGTTNLFCPLNVLNVLTTAVQQMQVREGRTSVSDRPINMTLQ
jgi:hypothetical protein